MRMTFCSRSLTFCIRLSSRVTTFIMSRTAMRQTSSVTRAERILLRLYPPTAVFRICLIFMQSYLRYRPAFRSASMSRFRPSTATFTEAEVSSLIFWSRPAASRS